MYLYREIWRRESISSGQGPSEDKKGGKGRKRGRGRRRGKGGKIVSTNDEYSHYRRPNGSRRSYKKLVSSG